MLGLGSLKDKIANLGEGLKSQFSVEAEPARESDLCAGSAVLTHYQSCWREIHCRGLAASKEADRCDRSASLRYLRKAVLSSLTEKVIQFGRK